MKANELEATFPQTIQFPPELGKLCQWTEDNGYPISGYFELSEHEDETIRLWFGSEAAVGDLAQFGSGADGSLYCVWRAPDGTQPIVHLGSEGDAILVLGPEHHRIPAFACGRIRRNWIRRPRVTAG